MAKRVYGQAAKTVTPEEALDLVLRFSHMTAPEIVSLSEAGGRTLDQDVIAAEPLPGNDRSLADGFAVGREDLTVAAQGKPLRLNVRDGNCSADAEIPSGTAVRLSAGETIPPGTGAVCRFEAAHVTWDGRRQVVDIPGPVRPWENIVRRGEEIARGTRVLAAGSVVGPAEAAVLAALGFARVSVRRKPVVAVLAIGPQPVDAGADPQSGRVRASNSRGIAVLAERAGCTVLEAGLCADDIDRLSQAIVDAARKADAVITTGGISVGDYDLLPAIYDLIGAETLFRRVNMQPGSLCRFAVREGKPILGLPGDVTAAFACAQLFAVPAMRRMAGRAEAVPRWIGAELAAGFVQPKADRVRYTGGTAYIRDGRLRVEMTGSGNRPSDLWEGLLGANCLIRQRERELPGPGGTVDLMLTDAVGIR